MQEREGAPQTVKLPRNVVQGANSVIAHAIRASETPRTHFHTITTACKVIGEILVRFWWPKREKSALPFYAAAP
jgi:hypothetical protein